VIYITAIHPAVKYHESIQSVRWLEPTKGQSGESTVAEIVAFLADNTNVAQVAGPNGPSRVGVEAGANGRKWIRTHADGQWNNNLLALPSY
jgi:hypothetical protein